MTLNPLPNYPSSRCYVLKLHRDAQPAEGMLSGQLEHVGSGDSLPFDSAQALLEALLAHAAATAARDSGEQGSKP